MTLQSMRNLDSIRVIVAEDEPLIAMMLEDTLSDMGLEVVGPFASVAEASGSINGDAPDIAVLDVDLADGVVYPLADQLHSRDIQLIFHTANSGQIDLARRYDGSRVVLKPSSMTHLQKVVELACETLKGE